MRSPGARKSTPSKPSRYILHHPSSPPCCMELSSNREGIFPPGELCSPLTARREQSAATQRTSGESPPPGEALDRRIARQAKRCRLVEYRSNRMDNSEYKRCTTPSGSTLIKVTRSRTGTRSTPTQAAPVRNGPWPERFSDDRAAPSLWTVPKRAVRISESSDGIALVPRSSATN